MHEAATAAGLPDGYAVSVIGGSPMIEGMGSRLESEYTDRAGAIQAHSRLGGAVRIASAPCWTFNALVSLCAAGGCGHSVAPAACYSFGFYRLLQCPGACEIPP